MLRTFLARAHPLYRRLQREPFYRFQSFEELRLAASWGLHIEANTASIDDWLRLPGISIHQARALTQLSATGLSLTCLEDVAAALGVPLQQVNDWGAVLQFCYYERSHSLEPIAIDVNTATAAQLSTVPAIDAFLGRAIVHYRQAAPYRDLADLQQRLRLNTQITAELLHYLRF
jgi:DNA uptake protein ComE-like DNA-binding protein